MTSRGRNLTERELHLLLHFLQRVVAKGQTEEHQLIHLVNKLERMAR